MKHELIPQFEFDWGEPEPFALVAEATIDGEETERQRERQQIEREKAKKQQPELV